MTTFSLNQVPVSRFMLIVVVILLAALVTFAGIHIYRASNPQHYYYGYPMPIEAIGEINSGAYCVALDQYNRMCFATDAEMMAFSAKRAEVQQTE